jgi:hypothetical protein
VHLQTDVDGVQGERTIDATSCESLATATALILALTVDPSKARASLPAEPTAPTAEAPPAPPPSPLPAPPRGSRERMAALVAIGSAGDLGTMPSPALAPQATVGLLFGPVRAELSGDDWGPQNATPAGDASEGAHLHLYDATLRGCFRWRFASRLELDPCVGAGLVYATSDGFTTRSDPTFTPYQSSGAWMTADGDLLAAWRLFGPIALRASVGAGAPLARPPFVVLRQQGPPKFLHESAAVIGRASLGLEARFP